ncbi:XVIPCD domain-containing protein [Xanthomonas campestris]|uniref:XVIPCD domain-containing protein n=1 Tax=Xanthomonas campestris TaxID=339 RepID=UPI0023673B3B|nr:XVIPCD domain-containing protein [Xanthomonas campestris]MEA9712069.1 XVIPCD domain-containing protein [Xanthomonas campestris]MEA9784876.1 XVIPCD domain-containing protein [Xanthomonas campestris pv. raphani]MEA9793251.1 XVIPCD domain-containing protein [Xanthomonas campestris pv. raphani]MEA9804683.1 XVIPCD domain-containing protein [Xanthomonas campestris pv. raphani]MEA9821452.1 XVIPCD domain-containing protein [Xanthomonas campestris pv. raphani]
MPELDINASADEVARLFNQGQAREASMRLDALRQDQSLLVQEALDRSVASRAAERIDALQRPGGLPATDASTVGPVITRLEAARNAPRFPGAEETRDLSQAQQHDIYASIVETRGDDAAHQALATQDRVILGLRNENRTTQGRDPVTREVDSRGTGVYDDRIVVLWRAADGARHAREFNQATTEPTAQYDGHAKTTPRSEGFAQVAVRQKTEGEDVNRDNVRDLGRLAEGTTEMGRTTHPLRNHPDEFALRPTDAAVANGQHRVERDSNGDGWFDARDTHGVQDLNNTFKIHRGSGRNTDSAGCQTIGGNEYDTFVSTVRGTPGQDRWQYVLTSVTPTQTLQQNQEQENLPTATIADPRAPGHPDHALQQQISGHLTALGGRYAQHADSYSLALLYDAKANGTTRVDNVVPSNAIGTQVEGARIFLVQGQNNDPAALRVASEAATIAATPVERSLQRLHQQQQTAAETQGQGQAQQQQEQHQQPTMGGR